MNTNRTSFGLLALLLALLSFPATLHSQTEQLDVAWALNHGQAVVTNSLLDIGIIENIFDGNTDTLARSASINPMVVTLSFTTPKQLASSRVWFLGDDNSWRVETADSIADLDSMSGTFQVALDWATAAQNSWQDRTFGTPISCRVVRLKLHRLTRDDYVHLNEWHLFMVDRPFRVTDLRRTNAETRLTWNSAPAAWYAIESSPDLAHWTNAGFQKASDISTEFKASNLPGNHRFFRVRKAQPEQRPNITRRVLVLNIDPILEAHGNQRLHQYLGWSDPHSLNTQYLDALTTASGGYVKWEVAAWVDLDLWPKKHDGFQYTDTTYLQSWADSETYPWHDPDSADYEPILDLPLSALGNKTAHQMAAAGEVDEIIWWAGPYLGFFESRMVGSTAYWCNAPELVRPSPLYVVMCLNPERGVAEALHSFGHRCESILEHVYGSWSGSAQVNHLWDRFTRVAPVHGVSVAGCGNVHFPPNASNDYEYSVPTPVNSEADEWLTFPNFSGSPASVSAATWGGPDYQGNFLRWWLSRFPKAPGRYVDPANSINNGKLNNWWSYIVDMNEYVESR